MSFFSLLCRPATSSSVNADGKKDKNAPVIETADTLVLLADCCLMELPLEALDVFESKNILSVSRDVSLQMLYHRYHEEQLTRKLCRLCICKMIKSVHSCHKLLVYSLVKALQPSPLLYCNISAEELKAKQQAKAAIPSRIPGVRDANKKQAKYIPLDRPIPANCKAVDTNGVKFMVDPHGDVVEEGE